MSYEVALTVITLFWFVIGAVLPVGVHVCMRTSPHKGLIQTMLVLTAVCCYVFWLCTFLAQLNPLFGPQLESGVIRFLQMEWDKK